MKHLRLAVIYCYVRTRYALTPNPGFDFHTNWNRVKHLI